MDRPLTEITLPYSKARVTLKEYLTSKELRLIRRKLLETAKVDPMRPENFEFNAAVTQDLEEKALELLLVSIVDNKGVEVTNTLEFVDNLRGEDGTFLYDAINAIHRGSQLSDSDKKK